MSLILFAFFMQADYFFKDILSNDPFSSQYMMHHYSKLAAKLHFWSLGINSS